MAVNLKVCEGCAWECKLTLKLCGPSAIEGPERTEKIWPSLFLPGFWAWSHPNSVKVTLSPETKIEFQCSSRLLGKDVFCLEVKKSTAGSWERRKWPTLQPRKGAKKGGGQTEVVASLRDPVLLGQGGLGWWKNLAWCGPREVSGTGGGDCSDVGSRTEQSFFSH